MLGKSEVFCFRSVTTNMSNITTANYLRFITNYLRESNGLSLRKYTTMVRNVLETGGSILYVIDKSWHKSF